MTLIPAQPTFPSNLNPKGPYSSLLLYLSSGQADDAGLTCVYACLRALLSGTAAFAPVSFHIGPFHFLPNCQIHQNNLSQPLSSRRQSTSRWPHYQVARPAGQTLTSTLSAPACKPFCLTLLLFHPLLYHTLSCPIISALVLPTPTLKSSRQPVTAATVDLALTSPLDVKQTTLWSTATRSLRACLQAFVTLPLAHQSHHSSG